MYKRQSFADAASMLTAILLERRIELLGEGRRTTDVQRLNQPLPAKGTIAALPTTASLYVWPLPQAELNVNKAAVQNP